MEEKIINYINQNFSFGEVIGSPNYPTQGLGGSVFFLNFGSREIVVKYGDSVENDYKYLKLIHDNNINVSVPGILGYFVIEDMEVLLLEKINGKLFGEVEVGDISKYFDTIIDTFNNLHKHKSNSNSWKGYLLSIFNGETINWEKVLSRECIDRTLLQPSLNWIIKSINDINFDNEEISLLHTDFNDSNLFINENTLKIIGVIDWEEATFGDPVYDFARFHLYLWHREVDENIIKEFFIKSNLDSEQIKNEKIYFVAFVVHYLAYYSEGNNEVSVLKVKRHQDFLRGFL